MNPKHYNQIERAVITLDKSHSTAVLGHDRDLIFQFKKAERIVAAIYILTSSLSDNEPIRFKVREVGTGLIHEILSLMVSSQDIKKTRKILAYIAGLLSLIDLAHISDMLSPIHYSTIKQELIKLLESVEKRGNNPLVSLGTPLIPESFFHSPPPYTNDKGHPLSLKNILYGSKEREGNAVSDRVNTDQIDASHKGHFSRSSALQEGRRSKIVAILRERGSVSVKDISEIIRDCSRKSIQRILSDLVDNDLLKTEGEKRWTRYVLKERQKSAPTSPS